jgi:hypothetical protein
MSSPSYKTKDDKRTSVVRDVSIERNVTVVGFLEKIPEQSEDCDQGGGCQRERSSQKRERRIYS